jgi:hypothetical protein
MGINSDLYNYHGVPRYYGDNAGLLTAPLSIVPEASACALLGLGIPVLLGMRGTGRTRDRV